jgi:DEP domain-containing protein 5
MEPLQNEKGSRPQTSSSSVSKAREPVERRCVLWIHDEQYSKEEVILNTDLFPVGTVKPGDLLAIVALKTDVAVKDFQERNASAKKGTEPFSASLQPDINVEERKSSTGSVSVDGQHDIDQQKRYLFAVKDMSKELKAKQPNLEVSIAKHIADVFGFKHRSNVLLTTVGLIYCCTLQV